ncbi:IstB-like ATP binding protein, partial [Quadrisphaera granulorum]
FQLIAARYETGSVLVTSNMPFKRWGEIFGDEVVAAAMIDRLVHHAEVIALSGESYRTRARRAAISADPAAAMRATPTPAPVAAPATAVVPAGAPGGTGGSGQASAAGLEGQR